MTSKCRYGDEEGLPNFRELLQRISLDEAWRVSLERAVGLGRGKWLAFRAEKRTAISPFRALRRGMSAHENAANTPPKRPERQSCPAFSACRNASHVCPGFPAGKPVGSCPQVAGDVSPYGCEQPTRLGLVKPLMRSVLQWTGATAEQFNCRM